MLAELLLMALVLVIIAAITAYTAITGISPLPSTRLGREAVLAALPEAPQGAIIEAGSGWGTLAFALARRRPGSRVIGYELSPLPWAFSQLRRLIQPAPNLRLYRRDLLRASYAEAGVVVCYLHAEALERLQPKLEAELPAGALVISNTFRLHRWRPAAVLHPPASIDAPVYVYRVPEAYTSWGAV